MLKTSNHSMDDLQRLRELDDIIYQTRIDLEKALKLHDIALAHKKIEEQSEKLNKMVKLPEKIIRITLEDPEKTALHYDSCIEEVETLLSALKKRKSDSISSSSSE